MNVYNSCSFTNSAINISDLFYTSVTEDRNCDLRLKVAKLDHEKKSEYQLQLKLDTLSGLVNPSKSTATVSTVFSMLQIKTLHTLYNWRMIYVTFLCDDLYRVQVTKFLTTFYYI